MTGDNKKTTVDDQQAAIQQEIARREQAGWPCTRFLKSLPSCDEDEDYPVNYWCDACLLRAAGAAAAWVSPRVWRAACEASAAFDLWSLSPDMALDVNTIDAMHELSKAVRAEADAPPGGEARETRETDQGALGSEASGNQAGQSPCRED